MSRRRSRPLRPYPLLPMLHLVVLCLPAGFYLYATSQPVVGANMGPRRGAVRAGLADGTAPRSVRRRRGIRRSVGLLRARDRWSRSGLRARWLADQPRPSRTSCSSAGRSAGLADRAGYRLRAISMSYRQVAQLDPLLEGTAVSRRVPRTA